MNVSETLGDFTVEGGFHWAEFDRVNRWMLDRTTGDPRPPVWFAFGSAWKGVVFRLRGARQHADAYSQLMVVSTAPPINERYLQDHHLFVFAASALSAIECFATAIHCLGNTLDNRTFPLQAAKDLEFYPEAVAKRLRKFARDEPLTIALAEIVSTSEHRRLKGFRNALAHRGTPPRRHFVGSATERSSIPSNPKSLSDEWVYDAPLEDVVPSIRRFVDASLDRLVVAAAGFCSSRL